MEDAELEGRMRGASGGGMLDDADLATDSEVDDEGGLVLDDG